MNQVNILATDKFKIVSKALPQEFHFQTLTKLYQPFIGATAVALYTSMTAEVQPGDWNQLQEWNHEQFLIRLGINMQQFINAKEKLEAVGLLRTQFDRKQHYFLYEVFPAKSGNAFFEDPILSGLLMEYVGEQQFAQLLNFFEGNHWNQHAFQDISKKLTSVFQVQIKEKSPVTVKLDHSKPVANLGVKIDVQLLKQLLTKTFVNQQSVAQNLQIINTVAVMYGLDEVQLVRLLEEAVDVSHQDCVNWNRFRALASQQYEFVMKPKKNFTSSKLEESNQQPVKKADENLINACKQYAPMEFLTTLKDEQGQTVTHEEQITIQRAVEAQKLDPAVINVLVHYMLVNENMDSLNQKYFERTANNWLKNKVNTPEKAIAYVREWQKDHQNPQKNSRYYHHQSQYTEKLPTWAKEKFNSSSTETQNQSKNETQDISRLMQRINQKTPKGDEH